MAAFHFTAKIHTRAKGASAVRAAAYRAAERLYDDRLGKTEDYTRKADVIEAAILAPEGAPAWVHDRQTLWNRAEARERRRDSQVAQELEINLPRELSDEENWRLITDFAREHLVAHGRVCDVAMHVHEAGDGGLHPHAHCLMPLRSLTGESFGEKHPDCDWRTFLKRRDRLGELRETWCHFARERAGELGIDLGAEWDHRSFETRGIDLEPGPKRGATAERMDGQGNAADRTAEFLATQRRNGEALLRNPQIALDALTETHSTFGETELARYIFQHSATDQFQAILAAARVKAICVGRDERGRERFSTKSMIAVEAKMVEDAIGMAGQHRHTVSNAEARVRDTPLSAEQRTAAVELLQAGDLACLLGHAGAGKSTMLRSVREELARAGYTVRGCAPSGIAAESLSAGSGIEGARTIASFEYAWKREREQLTAKDVLIVDEAGMVGSRGLARLIAQAQDAGAKIVLVGDPEQLQAIQAGAAFRAIAERVGAAELTEIRRQQTEWQREATRELATGRTAEALDRYRAAGCIEARPTDEDARLHLVERWTADRLTQPQASRIMLAHENKDVRHLNVVARDLLREAGQLGLDEIELETSFGKRGFAEGDRLIFRRNERTLDVKNGTLGTVCEIAPDRLAVRTDDGRMVALNPLDYKDVDHGYAVTVHRAQGVTVDQAYVLATTGFDRHLAYVACSRHRSDLTVVHSREAFAKDAALARVLGRERSKDTTLDYREEAMKPPTLDYPAPKPTQEFIDRHQPERPKAAPARDEVTDGWAAFGKEHDSPKRSRERQQSRDRGLER